MTLQPIPNLSGMIAVAAGGYHSLALNNDGTVWAWGGNWNGDRAERQSPVVLARKPEQRGLGPPDRAHRIDRGPQAPRLDGCEARGRHVGQEQAGGRRRRPQRAE